MKLRHLLPILNTVTLAVVAGVFVQSHGGVKGDYTYLGSVTDAPTEPGDYGRVFFNRWQFYGDRETALTKSFLFANIPGFGAAKAALWILRNTFEEFRTSYPFGLSYASYSLLLGFPFSLLQWLGIGSLLDWLRRRSALGLRALTLMMIWLSASTAAATTVTPVGRRAECSYDGRPCGETMTYLGAPTATFRVFRTGPLQFTGKERDAETGLDYFGARYFSGAQGRFTSPDPPGLDQSEDDPQSWNLYSYVRNNPLRFIDPTGHECVNLDGGGQGDDGKGTACAGAQLNTTHGVTVEGKKGNVFAAIGLNAFFALDATANAFFDPLLSGMGGRPSYMQDIPTNREFTGQVATAGVFVATTVGPGGARRLWTSTSKLSGVKNAFTHWMKHGKEFPNLQNAKQYVEAAHEFVTNPPTGTLSKVRPNGDTIFYNPGTNTFAVKAADGTPRTMFKPDLGLTYFHSQ